MNSKPTSSYSASLGGVDEKRHALGEHAHSTQGKKEKKKGASNLEILTRS